MESRNFKLDTEWNMIHYPEKPNGFGILIIGDERHFVDEKGSFWTQNEGKQMLINQLKNAGYTIFYSNLYGKNWGSRKAVKLAESLYEYIRRTEIINERIHLVAEGMGALVALQLLDGNQTKIRSMVLLNPVLSLKHHLEQEKDHKFFYKRLISEISTSFEVESTLIVDQIEQANDISISHINIPMKIIHVLSGNRAYKQSKLLNRLSVQWKDEKAPISVTFILPEKKQQLGNQIIHFISRNEKVL
ncbi:alpha/beta fold hydrolase [Bacillus massilinigeriensis]|uniref:alpha/beta fold hydrolase n=1 Tax=Bacillus massilionigeriensis TaxID=1805475 RepID=UPI00096B4694|nr:alpha/beta fold hydrolase [Bacillus massilionigeriensis]